MCEFNCKHCQALAEGGENHDYIADGKGSWNHAKDCRPCANKPTPKQEAGIL